MSGSVDQGFRFFRVRVERLGFRGWLEFIPTIYRYGKEEETGLHGVVRVLRSWVGRRFDVSKARNLSGLCGLGGFCGLIRVWG